MQERKSEESGRQRSKIKLIVNTSKSKAPVVSNYGDHRGSPTLSVKEQRPQHYTKQAHAHVIKVPAASYHAATG